MAEENKFTELKSTLIKAITGLLRPKEGQLLFDGLDVRTVPANRRARMGIGYSPEGRRVFATMTVNDNLLLGAFPRFTGARR